MYLKRDINALFVFLLLFSAGAITQGCASNYSMPSSKNEESILWPSPPEPPRIRFLYTINRPIDLNIGKSFFGTIKRLLLGESNEGILVKPYGIIKDRLGRLIVTDTGARAIHVYDTTRKKYLAFPKDLSERVGTPLSIAVDKDGLVYISDSRLGRIGIYDQTGSFISSIDNGIKRPTGIVINKEESLLYVVDTEQHKVLIFDIAGEKVKLVDFFGERGSGESQFNFPTNIFIDNKNDIYVTDSMNFRIQVFKSNGEFITKFGKLGNGSGHFSNPKGVAVDSEGNIYVVDSLFDNVQIFNIKGEFLLAFGKRGEAAGEFWLPSGIFIDDQDIIYVTDSYNGRIQVFQFLGSTEEDSVKQKP